MTDDDPMPTEIADWRQRHHIDDEDPILAVADLVRIHIRNATRDVGGPAPCPPSFEDFRATIELLDRRSKSFVQQSADTASELRRFGQILGRLNRQNVTVQFLLVALGAIIGFLSSQLL